MSNKKADNPAIAWTNSKDAMPLYAAGLLQEAKAAAEAAYAPYSRFKVGAALLLADGTVCRGCNVENASYGATVCAERVAVFSAVAAGGLSPDRPPLALAVTATPCALCLQVLSEFAGADFPVILPPDGAEGEDVFAASDFRVVRLGELLPHPFALD